MVLREDVNTGILLLVTAFLFFGSVTLVFLVVTFNPVSPSSVSTVISFMVFGLGSGVIAGTSVTGGELGILNKKGEFRISNLSILYAGVVGLVVFLVVNFFFVILGPPFVFGEVFFLFAGLFAYSLSRLILLVRWETQNKSVVMIQHGTFSSSGRLYVS